MTWTSYGDGSTEAGKVLTIPGESGPLLPLQAGKQGLGANSQVSCPMLIRSKMDLVDDLAVHHS